MKTYTESEVIALVRAAIEKSGKPAIAFAKARGISPSYLSDILNGNRRAPDRLLNFLGLKRETVIRYRG